MRNREKKKGSDRAFRESDNTGQPPKTEASWKPGDLIGYIRQEIPEFEVPAYFAYYVRRVRELTGAKKLAARVPHTEACEYAGEGVPYHLSMKGENPCNPSNL